MLRLGNERILAYLKCSPAPGCTDFGYKAFAPLLFVANCQCEWRSQHLQWDTYAARCIGNKYEIISRCSSQDQRWFSQGQTGDPDCYASRVAPEIQSGRIPCWLKDKVERPYALPKHNAITEAEWCRRVGWFATRNTCKTWRSCFMNVQDQLLKRFTGQWTIPTPSKRQNATKSKRNKRNHQHEPDSQNQCNKRWRSLAQTSPNYCCNHPSWIPETAMQISWQAFAAVP